MGKIFVTSDLHLCHDRQFVWGPRGFRSIFEMNETIIDNFNHVVTDDDDLYILGDLMLKDDVAGMKCMNHIPGRKHIILGNHDTLNRQDRYPEIRGFVDMKYADMLKYRGYHFFMCHFPTLTGNLDDGKSLKQRTINLCGHSHVQDSLSDWGNNPIFHVELDTNNCYPWALDDIIEKIETLSKSNKSLSSNSHI